MTSWLWLDNSLYHPKIIYTQIILVMYMASLNFNFEYKFLKKYKKGIKGTFGPEDGEEEGSVGW